MNLPVNEIFKTIQGEAYWTGTPSIFVRLQGCAVGCPWCDTKHTWELLHGQEISVRDMLDKDATPAPTYAHCSVKEIVQACEALRMRHVVLTGGEPANHDLRELCQQLRDANHTVQIETSGTAPIRVTSGTWVTLSPKLYMPGGKAFLNESLERANEIKMPVGKPRDVELLRGLLELLDIKWTVEVWLQPLSTSPKATKLCVALAQQYGYRVSVQTHKYLGVR